MPILLNIKWQNCFHEMRSKYFKYPVLQNFKWQFLQLK